MDTSSPENSRRPGDESPAAQSPKRRFALFEYGFRPFFFLCGVYAIVMIPWWLYRSAHGGAPFGGLPPMYWHAHELVYGFVMAAVAGFLLTAVPSWTGAKGFAGAPLILAVGLWLAGRVAMSVPDAIPFGLIAAAELSLVPCLVTLLAPPILRARNRNLPILGVLTILWVIDGAFLFGLAQSDMLLAAGSMRLAIDFVLILVTVIGGRIVPAFTANALRQRGQKAAIITRAPLEYAVIGLMVAIAIIDVFAPNGALSGVLAALAAIAHAARLSGWRSFRTGGEPILWVLHVAYAWLPLGLGLKALALLAAVGWAAKWQHALAVGAMATMILAVMTRASLGHTGRPLVVSRGIAVAYVLLTIAALLRTFGGALLPANYLVILSIAGIAWVASFGIFVAVYAPVLWLPRVDGKPG
jgi:uncharacterized protein involved in response to NO